MFVTVYKEAQGSKPFYKEGGKASSGKTSRGYFSKGVRSFRKDRRGDRHEPKWQSNRARP